MRLVFERTQRSDWLGRRWYRLSIAAVLNDVEAEIVREHGLGGVELWCSSVFLSHETHAMSQFERAADMSGWGNADAWQRLGSNRQGLKSLRAGFREGVITVADLMRGVSFEAREVAELMRLEGELRSSVQVFGQRIEQIARYEDRDVLVIDPEPKETGTPTAKWVTLR